MVWTNVLSSTKLSLLKLIVIVVRTHLAIRPYWLITSILLSFYFNLYHMVNVRLWWKVLRPLPDNRILLLRRSKLPVQVRQGLELRKSSTSSSKSLNCCCHSYKIQIYPITIFQWSLRLRLQNLSSLKDSIVMKRTKGSQWIKILYEPHFPNFTFLQLVCFTYEKLWLKTDLKWRIKKF